MPTGYTCLIENGKISTGKEFLKICIRGFGVYMDQREDSFSAPLQTHFDYNEYYSNCYNKAFAEYEETEKIDAKEMQDKKINEILKEIEGSEKNLIKKRKENEIYDRIREEIEKWTPPTKEHCGIKKFALNQIDISKHDISFYEDNIEQRKNYLNELQNMKPNEFKQMMLELMKKDVDYYTEQIEADKKRTDSRNLFMRQFLDSLEEIE